MDIIQILIPVFLVIGLGALSVFTKIFKPEDSYLFSRYDFYVGFPILIFYSLLHTDFAKISDLKFLGTNVFNLAIMFVLIFLVVKLFKIPKKLWGIFLIAGTYGNVAYMGFPINQLMFGTDGIGYASIITGVVTVFCLTVGIFLLEFFVAKKPNFKAIFMHLARNPIIIGIVLGVIASALRVNMPVSIDNFLAIVSKSAGPIALFAIGMFMVGRSLTKHRKEIAILCILNLIFLPIITYFVGRTIGLGAVPFKISLLEAAMPLAATNFVVAQKYKIGEGIISSSIIISTLASIITIGGAMLLFNYNIF